MLRKLISYLIMVVLLISSATSVFADSVDTFELTRFGYNNEQTRLVPDKEYLPMEPSWFKDIGKTYSQPLILDGSRFGVNNPVVVVMAGHYLWGIESLPHTLGAKAVENTKYLFKEPVPGPDNIKGSNKEPSGSHSTLWSDQGGDWLVSGGKDGILYLNKIQKLLDKTIPEAQRSNKIDLEGDEITAAPLVLTYKGKTVIVVANGDGGKAVLVTNLDLKDKNGNLAPTKIFLNIGGRITSSPVAVDNDGFIIGSDNAPGLVRGYFLDDILDMKNGNLVLIDNTQYRWQIKTTSGVPSSFAIDGDYVYFADKTGHFYKVNKITGKIAWENTAYADDNVFINHSPAVDSQYVYFPITSYGGSREPGALLLLRKDNGTKVALIRSFTSRIVNSPVVWEKEKAVVVGNEDGSVNFFDIKGITDNSKPLISTRIFTASADPNMDQRYAEGFTGEVSVGKGLFAAAGSIDGPSPDGTLVVWQVSTVPPPDLETVAINPGTDKTDPGEVYDGKVTFRFNQKDDTEKPVNVKLTLTHNGSPVKEVNGKVVAFAPGETKDFSFKFTGQDGKESKLVARIDPEPLALGDSNPANNSRTIILPPEDQVDLVANITTGIGVLKVGTSATMSASLYNSSSKDIQTTYIWRVNGITKVGPNAVTIPAGNQVKVSYKYTMPDVASLTVQNIEVEINPGKDKPGTELNLRNNKDSLAIKALKDTASDSSLSGTIITR
ncbi:MAG: hypothetical protein ACYC2T_11520 [Bacillota bacterium]